MQVVKIFKPNKIALVLGHTQKSKGAKSYNGWREWDWNKKVIEEIIIFIAKEYPKKEVRTFYRPNKNTYRASVQELGRQIGEWKAELSLEFHFNSIGHKLNAYGCEILVNEDSLNLIASIHYADELTDRLAEKFGLRERGEFYYRGELLGDGVKILKQGERGYYNLKYCLDYGIKVAMLIEPMFAGTKTYESEIFFETEIGLTNYARLVGKFLGEL